MNDRQASLPSIAALFPAPLIEVLEPFPQLPFPKDPAASTGESGGEPARVALVDQIKPITDGFVTLKAVMITLAGFGGFLLAVALGLYLTIYLWADGLWPFEPLARQTLRIDLPNGGAVAVEAIEEGDRTASPGGCRRTISLQAPAPRSASAAGWRRAPVRTYISSAALTTFR